MKTVAPLEYRLLGSPVLIPFEDGGAQPERLRFRHRPAWRLVAYLYGCGGNQTCERVCADLAIDSMIAEIVYDCNCVLGKGAVKRDTGSFYLDMRCLQTDAARFDALVRQSRTLSDATARARLLSEALEQVRGDFLAGLSESPKDWITKQQKIWQTKVAREGKELLALYDQLGQPREALDLVRHLATILPHDEEIETHLIRYEHQCGDLMPPASDTLAEWIAFTRRLTQRGETVTLRETRQFDKFFTAKWKRLKPFRSALERLCILEGDFDAEFTFGICEITCAELSELSDLALLIESDGRYEMPPPMRQWIRSTLPADQKAEMQRRYHEWIRFVFALEVGLQQPPQPPLFQKWEGNMPHLKAALNALLDAPLPLPAQRKEIWFDFCFLDIALRRKLLNHPSASPLYHQGMALVGLKRCDEALASFDEALELFKRDYMLHGQADCLQQMGKIHAERGQVNSGKHMIEEALQIYADIPQMQSRAACLRSLGDVLKLKGDLAGTQAAYCEGLAFWENEVAEGRGGESWVRRFQERLFSR